MDKEITFKQFGKQAILIEWKPIVSEEILKDILSFKNKIAHQKKDFFTDLIVGYNSLTIKYINEIIDFSNEILELKSIYTLTLKIVKQTNYLWEIPVCYDKEFGIDLDNISKKKNLEIEEIIALHSQRVYSVFFIGFLPGFLYLGGLNEQLFVDRKANPRLKVAKGAVAIGGKQTGVYPSESAGGWNIIGKTPIIFFNIENKNPCFVKPGDQIKFVSISLEEFQQLEIAIENKTYQISKTLLND